MTAAATAAHAEPDLPPGVRRVPIPIPWPMGAINVYLVEDDPLTLVDSGPNFDVALRALERGLAEHGRRVEDIGRIVLTHEHIDHIGLASEVARRSDAEVCAHADLVEWITDQPGRVAGERAYVDRLMRRHGVSEEAIERLRMRDHTLDSWDPSVEVGHPLADGDTLRFAGGEWTVMTRPGHSPFDTLLHDEARGYAFSGDHLISHISSNPVLTPLGLAPEDADMRARRPRALATYRDSLRLSLNLGDPLALPGHGRPIARPRRLVQRRLAEIDERGRKFDAIVAERARTAHEVAAAVWGKAAFEQPDLTLYEVLGHSDLLHDAGLVDEVERDGVVVLEHR